MIVYCLGMQSSGSTWLYNIVREIFGAAGLDHAAYRAEMYEHFLDPRAAEHPHAVLRGHNLETGLLRLLHMADIKTILTFREPRDAVASFLQRFGKHGAKFVPVCNDTQRNLATLLSASQHLEHLTFYYEDGFTERLETVRTLADFIGLPLADRQVYAIFDKYRAETVKSFIANIDHLPQDRLFVDDTQNAMDRQTSFHRTHISDMRIGKWRDVLDGEQQRVATELFADSAKLLQRHATGVGRNPHRSDGVQRLLPFRMVFASALFAPVDSLDHFTRFLTCRELYGSLGMRILAFIYLPEGEWDLHLRVPGLSGVSAKLCQHGEVVRNDPARGDTVRFRFLNRMHDHPFDLHLVYDGMEHDAATDHPPPRVTLEATLHRALDELQRPG